MGPHKQKTPPTGDGFRWSRPGGLEPPTLGLEGRCSIRLSYERRKNRRGAAGSADCAGLISGWPDSNRRSPAPKAGALATRLHPVVEAV
jgi:hypothetical protein